MAQYDLEDLLAEIETVLKDNLNTALSAIETAKGALTPALKTVDSGAYFLQTLDDRAANYDPYILYGVDDVENVPQGPYALERFKFSVVIVVADNGQDMNISKRMFRYRQALINVFRDNWQVANQGAKMRVSPAIPIPLTDINTNQRLRAVGVSIDVDLA